MLPALTYSPTVSGRASATVQCQHCPWRATHCADTVAEVVDFLGRRVNTHLREQHPERAPGSPS